MKAHEGTTFRAEAGGQVVELELSSARKVMESEAARLKRHPFSLFFTGPQSPHLPQGTYRMRHDAFDEPLDIFIVPVGKQTNGYLYEAVFT